MTHMTDEKKYFTEFHSQQEKGFVCWVMYLAEQLLRLKKDNTVRIVLKLKLEGGLSKRWYPMNEQIVRARLTRVTNDSGPEGSKFECLGADPPHAWYFWSFACAFAKEDTRVVADLDWHWQEPKQHGSEAPAQLLWAFLVKHFGNESMPGGNLGVDGTLPEVARISGRIELHDPLGCYAVLEGDSSKVDVSPLNVIDAGGSLSCVPDDELLKAC
jgi:hypothetical protein